MDKKLSSVKTLLFIPILGLLLAVAAFVFGILGFSENVTGIVVSTLATMIFIVGFTIILVGCIKDKFYLFFIGLGVSLIASWAALSVVLGYSLEGTNETLKGLVIAFYVLIVCSTLFLAITSFVAAKKGKCGTGMLVASIVTTIFLLAFVISTSVVLLSLANKNTNIVLFSILSTVALVVLSLAALFLCLTNQKYLDEDEVNKAKVEKMLEFDRPATKGDYDALAKWKKQYDDGIITQEQFLKKKKEILGD